VQNGFGELEMHRTNVLENHVAESTWELKK